MLERRSDCKANVATNAAKNTANLHLLRQRYWLTMTNQMKSRAPRIYFFLIGLAAALLTALMLAHYLASPHKTRLKVNSRQIDQYLNEIGPAILTFGPIAPRQGEVYYIHRGANRAELRAQSLVTGQTTCLALPQSAQQLFPWSPDGRYLPIKTEGDTYESTSGGPYAKRERLWVYDRDAGHFIPITTRKMVIGNQAVWLDKSSFLYSATLLADPKPVPKAFLARLDNGVLHHQEFDLPADALEALSARGKIVASCAPSLLAFCHADTVQLLDLTSGSVSPIGALSDGSFTGFNWLNWSPEAHSLLFCATRSGETYRNLFTYDLDQASVTRLSTVHSYNGQWLDQGQAYAFVANSNGDFSLWVHDPSRNTDTNLFANGYVERYQASPTGAYLIAIATTNGEPRGLWKYDLRTKALVCLQPGNGIPFRHTKISQARSLSVRSSDGLAIPIYLFPPIDEESTKRHALVIYVPPRTGPCHRGYERRPQLLANLGFYYAGVNYRGCDGYGRLYSAQWDEEKAAEDVSQAIQELTKNPHIDAEKVLAVSASAGSSVLHRLLRRFPGRLRAAAFLEPVAWEPDELLEAGPLPRLFVSIGRNDPGLSFVKTLQRWTRAHRFPAEFLYIPNYSHLGVDIPKRVAEEKVLAEFLLNNL